MALLFGFLFGFLGSIPIAGPISLLVFASGLRDRPRAGLYIALGGALAEGVYAGLAFWGVGALLERYPQIVPRSSALAAVILFALGLTFAVAKPKSGEGEQKGTKGEGRSGFALGFAITALNPTLIATWSAASAFAISTGGLRMATPLDALPYAGGVMVGIFSWFVVLLVLLTRFKGRVSRLALDRLVRVMGVALVALSCVFAWRFIRHAVSEAPPRAAPATSR